MISIFCDYALHTKQKLMILTVMPMCTYLPVFMQFLDFFSWKSVVILFFPASKDVVMFYNGNTVFSTRKYCFEVQNSGYCGYEYRFSQWDVGITVLNIVSCTFLYF